MQDGKLPRWTVTCVNGHVKSTRAEKRPRRCSECGADLVQDHLDLQENHRASGSSGRRRPSGDAALFQVGDGRLL